MIHQMVQKIFIAIVLSLSSICSQNVEAESDSTIPANVDQCILQLKQTLPKDVLERLRLDTETNLWKYNTTIGMNIRNDWIWSPKKSPLAHYFFDLGIHHPDNMSAIIMSSLKRNLNSQPTRLDELISHFKNIESCQNDEVIQHTQVPMDLKETELKTNTGSTVKLAEFSGKVLILVIWSINDNDEANAASVQLNALRNTYKESQLQILGLLVLNGGVDDSIPAREKFFQDNKTAYPVVIEPPRGYVRALSNALISPGILTIPETILIGKDGAMVVRYNGWKNDTAELLRAKLDIELAK